MSETPLNEFDPCDFLFVTMFTYRKRKVFIRSSVNEVMCRAMEHHVKDGNVVIAGYVIMPEHVHLLLRPEDMAAHQFVNNFKSYTGIKIKEAVDFNGKVWRQRFYDEDVADAHDFADRLALMHYNPVKKGMVAAPEDYPWSSYAAYNGGPCNVPVFTAPV